VLLKPGADILNVNNQLAEVLVNHLDQTKFDLFLHPLGKLHLEPDRSSDFSALVFFNTLIGILILILALVNFINLSISFSLVRTVEIGIRKTNGSGRKHIVFQFLSESVFISVIAFAIALGFAYLFLPYYNKVVSREIDFRLQAMQY
jgi:putative ABC transport system permease protein